LGINAEQLESLTQIGKQKYQEKKKEKPRLIKAGGGREAKLRLEEQIILTLFYLHNFPTFQILGIQFGVSESTAHKIFHEWIEILEELLPPSLMEQLKKKGEKEWVKEILEEMELLVDTTEQLIERPSDPGEQKKLYSGKKKAHTVKTSIISTAKGTEIIDIKVSLEKVRSDLNLWREQEIRLGKNQRYRGDKAYQGEERIEIPHKKPKGKVLKEEEKEENRRKARERIFVEHLIRQLKKFRIVGERFRLWRQSYEKIIRVVCGLVRGRIGALILDI
ncbi:transposase, partial [Roseofilum reptotaenium CS-1145]|uniref:transposase n=1 Tax=Roseofilum reptotaenium TaxID=1233427 RepID=UPI0023314824